MSFSMLSNRSRPSSHHRRPLISLLIPFHSDNPERQRVFEWCLRYWKHELPNAQVVIGRSHSKPFCKTEALNHAAKRATGRVLVVLDADTYMPGRIITRCAERIIEELDHHLWYVPYRHLYRLNRTATARVTASDPANPLRFPSPPDPADIDGDAQQSGYGHRYGAMITIFPREALDVLGCFDERFNKGWGGEDIALLRALDTLYGKHKTTRNDVLHLWHPVIGANYRERAWAHQKGSRNDDLSNRYNAATGRPREMRKLVDEGCEYGRRRHRRRGACMLTLCLGIAALFCLLLLGRG